MPLPGGGQHPKGPPGLAKPLQPLYQGAANVCATTNDPLGSCQLGKGMTPLLWDEAKQRNMCPGQDHGAKWTSQELLAGGWGSQSPSRVCLARRSRRAPVRFPQPQAPGAGTNEAAWPSFPFSFHFPGWSTPSHQNALERTRYFLCTGKQMMINVLVVINLR